jgi:UDP-galactose transporter
MFANRSPLQIQWFAIAFQMLGLFVSQYEEKETGYPLSIYTLLGLSTLIAASCGCYNDYISKVGNTSLHLLNIYLYFFGFVLNLGYFWALRFTKEHQIGFFDGYSVCAVAILVCNSIIGLVITAVYKYADAIVKCIAQSISTSVLILCSWYFFGCKIRVMTVAGCLIVFFASYVYFFAKDLMTLDHAPKKVLKEKEPSPVKQKRKPVHSFMIVLVGTVILASILIGFSYYNFMSHNHVKVSANIF